MHSSGSMTRMRSAWWMQSTGQTSTHERSLMSMQGSAMMYVTGRSAAYSTQALDLGSQLLDELRGALLQRVLDHDLVEARLVCAPQPGRVGVAAEAEDRHVRIEIRDLLRIDAGGVGDEEIALAHCDGGFYAVQAHCLHLQGPLPEGRLEGCVLSCPWHGWQYDVRTGENEFDLAIKLRTYDVQVADGEVRVRV